MSPVGPSTTPSPVVATSTSPADVAASRRASAIARIHRVSPLPVCASIDNEESSTMSVRPRAIAAPPVVRDGRVMARASASAMASVTTSDTARRIRSQKVNSRVSSSTRRQSSSEGRMTRGGLTLRRNSHAAIAAAAARSSPACHAVIVPNVTRGTVRGGTP
jgi:hypothetical protein